MPGSQELRATKGESVRTRSRRTAGSCRRCEMICPTRRHQRVSHAGRRPLHTHTFASAPHVSRACGRAGALLLAARLFTQHRLWTALIHVYCALGDYTSPLELLVGECAQLAKQVLNAEPQEDGEANSGKSAFRNGSQLQSVSACMFFVSAAGISLHAGRRSMVAPSRCCSVCVCVCVVCAFQLLSHEFALPSWWIRRPSACSERKIVAESVAGEMLASHRLWVQHGTLMALTVRWLTVCIGRGGGGPCRAVEGLRVAGRGRRSMAPPRWSVALP